MGYKIRTDVEGGNGVLVGSSGNPDVFTLCAVAEDLWYTSCWVAHREGPRLTTSAVLSCHQLRLISERSMLGVETTRSERTGLQFQSPIEVIMILSFARSHLLHRSTPSPPPPPSPLPQDFPQRHPLIPNSQCRRAVDQVRRWHQQ